MGELSEQNRELIERVRQPGEYSVLPAWIGRLLDAARTEGRGGEPVAWRYRQNASRDWAITQVKAWADEFAANNTGDLQPLYASPIREPEISRTVLGEPCTLEACPVGLFIADACDTLGMKTEYHTDKGAVEAYIVESGEFFWGDNPQTVERQRAQIVRPISHADAILNLAPVGGREEGSSRADLSPASRSQDQHSDGGRG